MLKTYTDRQLRKGLIAFEVLFCIYAFLFYTQVLYVLIGGPLPVVMGAVRYSVFGVSLILLLLRHRTLLRILPKGKILWLCYGYCGMSVLWSIFPGLTIEGFLQGIVQVTLFALYFSSRFSPKDQLRLIGVCMAITVIINMIYVVAIPSVGIHVADKFAGAWKGIYRNKNQFSGAMLWSLVVFYLLSFKDSNRLVTLLARVGLVICPILVILSTSKTALVLFMFLYGSLALWNLYRWKGGKTILMLDLGILTSFLVIGGIINHWVTIMSLLGKDPTMSGRTDIWQAAIVQITQKPLLGYGFSAFWTRDNPAALWIGDTLHKGFYTHHSHNGFIDILLDIGWVGMALFLLMFLSTWWLALKYAYRPGAPEDCWPLAVMLLITSYNITESSFLSDNIDWLFFLIAVLSMRIWPRHRLRLPRPSRSQENSLSRSQERSPSRVPAKVS